MIKKIVLTGGPGSGKTTVINQIKEKYEKLGYTVFIVDETATYLILNGIKPNGDNALTNMEFQELVMKMQIAKEEIFEQAAKDLPNKKILIVYDRGTIDGMAYIDERNFLYLIKKINPSYSYADLINKYDLVLILKSRKDFYTTENNKARGETVEEALRIGDVTLKNWCGHSNLKIILPKDTIEEKISEVLSLIDEAIKEPQIKKQKKFLMDLKNSDLDFVRREGKTVTITQHYLKSSSDIEKRIRKVEFSDSCYYIFSSYKILDDGKKILIKEIFIDEDIYQKLLQFKDDNLKEITKERIYFAYQGIYYKLDIFDDELGIIETDNIEGSKIVIPPFIKGIKDVSDDLNYLNKNLAQNVLVRKK